jgi:L-ascorbate metabolism protein UlaG (beta-lactamase superfamily)
MAKKPLEITYISHACIALDGEFGRMIVDPWILNEPIYTFTTWKFPAAIIPPEEAAKNIDYLFLSHPHEDHLHIPSLNYFSRDVQVILPEYASKPGLRAQMVERTFREMGFHNIRKIQPWETIDLGGDSQFTLIPAGKSKWWDWENSGFMLVHHDAKILNMNDCPSDKELYAEVDRRFGEIDLAFVQYSGVSMFPGCYRMSREEMQNISVQRRVGWGEQRSMIEQLKVKRLAPFAGDFAWLDDRMMHCNWSNRATPKLFSEFVEKNYPEKNIDVVIMAPTDTWTPKTGHTANHPGIDWDNYLDAINEVKATLQPKVDAIRQWIDSSDVSDLKKRSRAFTDHINRWITQSDVNFSSRVRVMVEGPNSGFSFVMKASPETGFALDWDDAGDVDQTLFIRETLWAAAVEGKVLLNNIQWASENHQHVEFRMEMAYFWFWFETHIDLNNRNPQALIDRALHPQISERIRPGHGVFPLKDEWKLLAPKAAKKVA